MAHVLPEELIYNQDRYITAKQIPEVLASIGIERGFSKANLYRKMADGTFDVPYHLSGRTKLWKPSAIIAWWNSQPTYSGPDRQIVS